MMSIAGVIGAALFVGSGSIIAAAGPAVILAYCAGGALVVFIMRMLGEMAATSPDTGSFRLMQNVPSGAGRALRSVGCTGGSGYC